MKKILITGANGYLGSQVLKSLKNVNLDVHALVRSEAITDRLNTCISTGEIHYFKEIQDLFNIIDNIKPDIIFNSVCAYENNKLTDTDLIEANSIFGMQLICKCGQMNKNITIINCDTALEADVNKYALTKKAFTHFAEAYVSNFCKNVKFKNLILQSFYGPTDDPNKFINRITRQMMQDVSEIFLTDGSQRRDYIYITDLTDAIINIIMAPPMSNSFAEIGLGTGISKSVKEYVLAIHNKTNSMSKLKFGMVKTRLNEPRELVADTSYLESIGWKSIHNFDDGIEKIIKHNLDNVAQQNE